MTDHPETLAVLLTDAMDSIKRVVIALESPAEQVQHAPTPPQFEVGDEVIVWATGERVALMGQWRLEFAPNDLLHIPDKPPNGKGYEVGEYKRIDESDEGWLLDGRPYWRDTVACEVGPLDHGYRFPLSRVPEPLFEINDVVRITSHRSDIYQGLCGTIDSRGRLKGEGWQYGIVFSQLDGICLPESDLEAVSATDEARVPEAKFKKGDVVRVIKPYGEGDGAGGEICEVSHNTKRGWRYKIPGMGVIPFWYSEVNLELADEARVPEPKFAVGQKVCRRDPAPGAKPFVIETMEEYEVSGWSYSGHDEDGVERINFECNLELSSATDEAPRHDLPSTPPPYEGKDGKVEMRWVRGEDGDRLARLIQTHEYYYSYDTGVVRQARIPTARIHYLCEPVPVVQGWDGDWLRIELDPTTGRVIDVVVCGDIEGQPLGAVMNDEEGVLYMFISAKDFPVPTNIVIPESSHE